MTILPLKIKFAKEKDLSASMAFYPLVGGLLGIILTGMAVFFHTFFPQAPAVLFLLLAWVILTGGLHLDGLADTLDGFIGGKNRESTLSIMRDPAIGTMGALGIFFVLALKGGALYALCEKGLVGANNYSPLPFTLATGRYLMGLGAFVSRYPHTEGAGKNYIGRISVGIFTAASLFALFIAAMTFQLKGLLLLLTAMGGSMLWIKYCHKRINGMTGDTLGALGEVSEALLLVTLSVGI
ncbi:MAG: adenosylcobinamide-GDP ribazoletransferase [Candidatus Omnitrophica bacterium]|nr:adenosylcobinamide-GDP ribazoletransferase [Candidatus Omnitrophota bacterium]